MRAGKLASAGIVAIVIVVWVAAEMMIGAAVIRIENQSSRELRALEVRGNGFNERVARLGAGESICVRPSGIRGESGLQFRATTDNGTIEAKDLAYLEASGGYHVRIEVSPVDTGRGRIVEKLAGNLGACLSNTNTLVAGRLRRRKT